MIEERQRVLEQKKNFQMIMRVSVSLHPSNPDSSELWKDIDQRLKKVGASSYQEQYDGKNESNGLSIERVQEDDDLKAKIAMAEDGYGRAEVRGVMGGKAKVVSTHDNPITASAAGDDTQPKTVLSELWGAFKQIFARFMQE